MRAARERLRRALLERRAHPLGQRAELVAQRAHVAGQALLVGDVGRADTLSSEPRIESSSTAMRSIWS